jgi:hypothetical protein
MRLEVLELIQMQMQGVEPMHGLNSQSADLGDLFEGSQSIPEVPFEIPPHVSFEDITEAIQEIRILISKRGMENMVVGSLLATPMAMLPLQDVEDTCGGLQSESISPSPKQIASTKKTLQVSELISMMDATTESLSHQVCPSFCLSLSCFGARSESRIAPRAREMEVICSYEGGEAIRELCPNRATAQSARRLIDCGCRDPSSPRSNPLSRISGGRAWKSQREER